MSHSEWMAFASLAEKAGKQGSSRSDDADLLVAWQYSDGSTVPDIAAIRVEQTALDNAAPTQPTRPTAAIDAVMNDTATLDQIRAVLRYQCDPYFGSI